MFLLVPYEAEWQLCAAGQAPSGAASSDVAIPSPTEPSSAAGGSSGGGGGPASGGGSGTVDEQIAVTLLQLQQDMNNVLVRLQSLETLTLQQASVPQGYLAWLLLI